MDNRKMNLESKVAEIEKILSANYTPSDVNLDNGLLSRILFFSYLYIYKKEDFILEKIEILVLEAINRFNTGEIQRYSFFDGASGLFWLLGHLNKIQVIDFDLENIDSSAYDFLFDLALNEICGNNFDYMYGGLGFVLPLLETDLGLQNNVFKLERIVNELNNLLERTSENQVVWHNEYVKKSKNEAITEYNLGLAHGIPSIITLLSKIYSKGISVKLCEQLIVRSVNWLLDQKHTGNKLSCFPNIITNNQSDGDSRLAWCYGDLGIANTLWVAGSLLNKASWQNESLAIMDKSISRKDLGENGVMDAGICHGSAGIAHFYTRFYYRTQNTSYLNAANYWMEQTLLMANRPDGFAGFKTWSGKQRGEWANDTGLIEGVLGIGLVMLGFLNKDAMKWDECLLFE